MDKYQDLVVQVRQPHVKGVIFDFDGTLIQLSVDWRGLKAELCQTFSCSPSLRLRELVQEILTTKSEEERSCALRLIEQYELAGAAAAKPKYEMLKLVRQLKNTHRLALFSANMLATISFFLTTYQLTETFQPIVAKDTGALLKPSPAGLYSILVAWNLTPNDVLYVGNDQNDQIAGNAAGIKTIII